MCSYIGIKVSKTQYIQLKKIEKQLGIIEAMKTLQSGFEYANWPIIKTNDAKNDIEIVQAHWEFIPSWIKNNTELKIARKQGIPWLNATAEKLLESKMFKEAALQRRCLIPVSHFYEWRHYKPEGSKKPIAFPYIISIKEKELFYLAGIYQPWLDKETGELKDCFAIITTTANNLMRNIHNNKMRMPTILNEALAYEWLFENLPEYRIKEIASFQYESTDMIAHTIPKDFRTVEDPTVNFEYNDLPKLETP
jgi:putative SOS response-associated peptidase YedK